MKKTDFDLKNKKVLLMGLGLNGGGLETAKWLIRRGAKLTVTDLKSREELAPSLKRLEKFFIRYVLGRHRESDFRSADLIVKGQGIPGDNRYLKAAREAGVRIETDISLFFRLCPAKIVGITGTKGKSTTAALSGDFFKEKDGRTVVAGNMGVSPLKFLDRIRPDTPVVLELSSWQLEGLSKVRKSPHIGIITNIFRDHLNYHKTMERYAKAKGKIIEYQEKGDFAVLNIDDPRTGGFGRGAEGRVVWFSVEKNPRPKSLSGVFVERGELVSYFGGKRVVVLPLAHMKLRGGHNAANAAAAIAAAMACGIGTKPIRKVLKRFSGIPHRMESLGKIRGVEFVNDTAATVPEAAISAMKSVGKNGRIILLAGGADKDLEFGRLAREIRKSCKAAFFFRGTGTEKIMEELEKTGCGKFETSSSMKEAIGKARAIMKRGDTVLLSPACASFGIFINEFDRGNRFKREVNKIRKENAL